MEGWWCIAANMQTSRCFWKWFHKKSDYHYTRVQMREELQLQLIINILAILECFLMRYVRSINFIHIHSLM